MAEPTAAQLLQLIHTQQTQIAQLLQQNAQQAAPAQNQQNIIPALPDISNFEPSDEKSRIAEWLDRFKFALDCVAPAAADQIKVKALMNKLSEAAFSEYSKSCLPAAVTDHDFNTTVAKLEKLFAKPQSIFIDRYECLIASRGEGEDFRQFINRHKRLLNDFQFGKLKEEQFKSLMLLTALKSSHDAVLRQRILAKLTADGDKVKYDEIVDDCINYMTTIAEAKVIESSAGKAVYAMCSKGKGQYQQKGKKPNTSQNSTPTRNCWRCGKNHNHAECKHKSAKCHKCGHVGHLEAKCEDVQEWRRKNSKSGGRKNVGNVRIGTARKAVNTTSLLKLEILMNNKPVKFVLDCGAEVNIIDEATHTNIGCPEIRKCTEKGTLFDGTQRPFIGKGRGTFEFNGTKVEHDFYVAKKGSLNLLSIQTMDAFGLLDELKQRINGLILNLCRSEDAEKGKKLEIPKHPTKKESTNHGKWLQDMFPDVFKMELGRCTKVKAHLALKDDAQPVYRKARPVPYNAKEVIDRELDRLENMGVIKEIEHTEWAAPILIVKKADGSARLCIDYSTGLNDALKDHQHPLPLPEDIFATLNGGKYFSQIDLRDAYLQVELDDESKKLCSIATHRGNYELQRLPFGVKTALGIFQSTMDQMLAGLGFATAYLDDIIVASKSAEEHKEHLEEVFSRIDNFGLRVKMEKCRLFQLMIKYLGQIIDKNGRRPDPKKVAAIAEMPPPKDIPTLRSFLGMVNHYQQYVKNMRFIRKPMDELLKKDTEWKWDEKCQKAFEKIKEILNSDLLLTHYDPKQEIIVAADASEMGIGAVISHRFPDGTIKTVAHASSTLTPAERNYSQIEKEGLALIFAVQKFHKMIYGRKFILQTDHKPLLAIFGSKKGIRQTSANRLLRWSLILLAYDFQIEYINTNDFGQADALSRLIAKDTDQEEERVIAMVGTEKEMESILIGAVQNLPLKFQDIAESTQKDETIQKVIKFTREQWPNDKGMTSESEEIKLYHRRKDDLSITKECLMYGERVVIPEKNRQKILQALHKGHPGIKRMKQLARQHVYWPRIDAEIEDMVRNCEPCQLAAKAPVKTELRPWPKATKPWQRVHIDYAGPFFGKEYLIVVDAHSKYPEVFEMTTKSTAATIDKLRYLFTRHGLPEVLVSDNGTQFTSGEFANFMKLNGIMHMFSAAYNPMSNGQAERFVDTFKRTFKKLKGEGAPSREIIETFLVTYRTTPNDSLPEGKSPAELFLSRKIRTTLDLLQPPQIQPMERDPEMERRFNKRFGTKPRDFGIGDKVFARQRVSQNWRPGKITNRTGVIYDVTFSDGSVRRFHANQLRARHIPDRVEDHLTVFHDLFNLPKPPEPEPENPIVVQEAQHPPIEPEGQGNHEIPNENGQNPGNNQGGDPPANVGPERRYPRRENRRPPDFYRPS